MKLTILLRKSLRPHSNQNLLMTICYSVKLLTLASPSGSIINTLWHRAAPSTDNDSNPSTAPSLTTECTPS